MRYHHPHFTDEEKVRFREVKSLAQGHTVGEKLEFTSLGLTLESILETTA